MTSILNDLKHGLRMLVRKPGFTAVVLVVIGVSIAANTALFNAMDQVYMRPLPVRDPDALSSIQSRYRYDQWEFIEGHFSYPNYEVYRNQSGVFSDLAAFGDSAPMNLRIDEETTLIHGMAVSPNYFSTLGLVPAMGRLLSPADAPSEPVAAISHGLWRRCFGGRADVIGKQIVVDNRPLTIVGVTPARFTGTIVGRQPDMYVPLAVYAKPELLADAGSGWLHLLGRFEPNTSRQQAQAALQVLHAQMHPRKPGESYSTPLVFQGRQGYVPRDAQIASYPLAMFLGIAVLVLVIACANVANLQLSRAVTRQKEIAIRQAIGAGRRWIVRQLMAENLILAMAAGAFGILLAVGLNRIVCTVLPQLVSGNMPTEIHLAAGLHWRVLLFALVTSIGTGVAFGLAPALQMIRRDVIPALKESSGLVKPVKLRSILEESRPWAYFPLAQYPKYTPTILIRTEGSPKALVPTIRDQAMRIQPAPARAIETIAQRVWNLLLPQRILTAILNSFALAALLLSATGIYAVISYAVKQRIGEIGIRIALGARNRHILTPILLRGTLLLALGLALGLGLSVVGIQFLATQLITVRKWDKFFLSGIDAQSVLTYASAALPIVVVTLLACYLPARRAARINPMEALRCE